MAPSSSANAWVSETGAFERPKSQFRNWVSTTPNAKFPAERGRYHLYIAYSCPWAHRALILRQYKHLEDVISFTAMHWLQDEKGWRFATQAEEDDKLHLTPDPYHPRFTHLQDLYLAEMPEYKGRYTTPTLYDIKAKRIVSNESADIIRMLNSSFDQFVPQHVPKPLDLYPEGLRDDIDLASQWIYTDLNNGVYAAGFAESQGEYEKATRTVFAALDRVEATLSDEAAHGPFFYCKGLTEIDVRLFTTIIRFDVVYVQHFKVNIRDIRNGYPAIHNWLRHLYWKVPAFHDTTNFDHIKKNYTRSQLHVNPHGITPLGPIPHILPLEQAPLAMDQLDVKFMGE